MERNIDVSVVVASHERPLRLLWLLNALEEQTLARERFEVVVVHDSAGAQTEAHLRTHPLTRAGVLRRHRLEPGSGTPARQRNVGWRLARAPLIAFTDDDCRPALDWLERLVDRARSEPGAIVQGATRPDPFETDLMAAPHFRTLEVEPPTVYAQTCNILYPRDVLERVGGMDEQLPAAAGEDTDLALRARAAGAAYVGEPAAVVYHAVESFSLIAMLRLSWKWQHLAYVLHRHPSMRSVLLYGIFWRPTHMWLPPALLAATLARRHPLALVAAIPYLRLALTRRGHGPRAVARGLLELPGRVTIDANEIAALCAGSVRYRELLI